MGDGAGGSVEIMVTETEMCINVSSYQAGGTGGAGGLCCSIVQVVR